MKVYELEKGGGGGDGVRWSNLSFYGKVTKTGWEMLLFDFGFPFF